ncbi:MAG TPA: acylphosphatase [Candidatus Bathyarchaeia archaeon]|nr:acylphosphatase [Candidatus Bathyarchaeia archaeon]
MRKTVEILVSGYVQAVGFRFYAKRHADYFGLTGFVQNLPDGNVRVIASGPEEDLARYIERLKEGPRAAVVKNVKVTQHNDRIFRDFVIKYAWLK